MITLLGLGHLIQKNIDSPHIAIQGLGIDKFQVELGEFMEIHGVLFVPEMIVIKVSVSSFEHEGYGMMVRYVHVFLYRIYELVGTTFLLGDHNDELYVLRGYIVQPGAGAEG